MQPRYPGLSSGSDFSSFQVSVLAFIAQHNLRLRIACVLQICFGRFCYLRRCCTCCQKMAAHDRAKQHGSRASAFEFQPLQRQFLTRSAGREGWGGRGGGCVVNREMGRRAILSSAAFPGRGLPAVAAAASVLAARGLASAGSSFVVGQRKAWRHEVGVAHKQETGGADSASWLVPGTYGDFFAQRSACTAALLQ